jgi:LDH2 family malate/lactate/ureidoglycolate dehydrogenase
MSDTSLRVPAEELRALQIAIWAECGMDAEDSTLLADCLVEADLRGVYSHGTLRVPEYVKKLTHNGVSASARPEVVRDFGACMVVDANNAMGIVGAAFAMRQAIARAETTGIAAVGVRGSNHCGAMAYLAMMALPRDMIGIATTNALPTMAPWGGAERILGIDPLGVAIPAGEELPIVYDAAFSATAVGKIRVYQQRGDRLPDGWALDREGRPTNDPAAALAGLLMPIGGYKGTGLAMIMGILSSMLSGAAYGTELGSLESGPNAGKDGHFLAAIKVAAFEDPAFFKRRVDGAIREARACRRAPGVDRIYAPGELEFQTKSRQLREGILLNPVCLADLKATAEELGVETHRCAWLA